MERTYLTKSILEWILSLSASTSSPAIPAESIHYLESQAEPTSSERRS